MYELTKRGKHSHSVIKLNGHTQLYRYDHLNL